MSTAAERHQRLLEQRNRLRGEALGQDQKSWYTIQAKKDGPADVYIYDEIGFWGVTASSFVRDLQAVDSDTVNLHINSPGGDVFDGIAIYNAIKDHDATFNVSIDALAASAASFIAMAGDTVVMNRQSTMMIHDAHGFAIGNAADMRDMADLLDRSSDTIASIYSAKSGRTRDQMRGLMKDETWMTGDEAVALGLADEAVPDEFEEERNPEDRTRAAFDLTVYNFTYEGRDEAPDPKIEVAASSRSTTTAKVDFQVKLPVELINEVELINDKFQTPPADETTPEGKAEHDCSDCATCRQERIDAFAAAWDESGLGLQLGDTPSLFHAELDMAANSMPAPPVSIHEEPSEEDPDASLVRLFETMNIGQIVKEAVQ